MGTADGLSEMFSEFRRKFDVAESSPWAERIINKIVCLNYLTNQEILDIQQEVREFAASDPPEEDLKRVCGYTESLAMVCSAIRSGDLDGREPWKRLEGEEKEAYEKEAAELQNSAKAKEAEFIKKLPRDENGKLVWDQESSKIHRRMVDEYFENRSALRRKYGINRGVKGL